MGVPPCAWIARIFLERQDATLAPFGLLRRRFLCGTSQPCRPQHLRDARGDVRLVEESDRERVEIRCDFCGHWVTHAAPVAAGSWHSWICYGGVGCDE